MSKRNLKIVVLTITTLFISTSQILSQSLYEETYILLDERLKEQTNISFKDAVFATENAYLEGTLSRQKFDIEIEGLVALTQKIAQSNEVVYHFKDKEEVNKYAALYNLMTDTQSVILSVDTLYHFPFMYDFEDMFGDKNWSKMFVSKLMDTHKGNCHSLPYLYKILADEIGADAHLALAPNHVYIKHRCEKAGWYNTELTSASFPIDAWLMASGYVHLDAIRNGLYMEALDDKKSIAMCVVDLAMGYDRKFPDNDGAFILQCCNLALEHFPNYINGLLLKAETMQRQYRQMMKDYKVQYPKELFPIIRASQAQWEEMEKLYFSIHKLGYRQMPKQMYIDWLVSLKEEREKYSNRKVTNFTKPKNGN